MRYDISTDELIKAFYNCAVDENTGICKQCPSKEICENGSASIDDIVIDRLTTLVGIEGVTTDANEIRNNFISCLCGQWSECQECKWNNGSDDGCTELNKRVIECLKRLAEHEKQQSEPEK